VAPLSILVYCGSSPGLNPAYTDAARRFGAALVRRGHRHVYGGGHVGLMGVVADAVLAGGGEAHGVITEGLAYKEVGHDGLTQLDVVATMHERKARMADLSDAVVMLPGGYGTLDEFFEAVTWTQLGIHDKPCGVLNVAGFFDSLLAFVDRALAEGFIREKHRDMLIVGDDADALLDRLVVWRPDGVDKWLDRSDR
jgi:uncharacterized protein (TIGR00730 family)